VNRRFHNIPIEGERTSNRRRSAGHARRDDAKLIRACLAGDYTAWDVLVARYSDLVYSVLIRTGLRESDAQDAFQEVWVSLFEHLGDVRDTERLAGWLVCTALRQGWRTIRRHDSRREVGLEDEVVHPNSRAGVPSNALPRTAEELVLAETKRQIVREAVESLPRRCREVLSLLYVADPPLSYADVADKLEIAVGSVGPTRTRCLACLREKLAQDT
jgi:RNA polymerase sigma factor (sigma-70 family)